MGDYRVICEFREKEVSRIIKADTRDEAEKIFLSKVSENQRPEVKIKAVNLMEPETKEFCFTDDLAIELLQYCLEGANADEYDEECFLGHGKNPDDQIKQSLNELQEFIKKGYLTNIKLVLTTDQTKKGLK